MCPAWSCAALRARAGRSQLIGLCITADDVKREIAQCAGYGISQCGVHTKMMPASVLWLASIAAN